MIYRRILVVFIAMLIATSPFQTDPLVLDTLIGSIKSVIANIGSQIAASLETRPAFAQSAPTSGLVGYWNFDEGSGSTASDSSGQGNHGTLVGSPAWTSSGKIGGALTFGTNNYVNVGHKASLAISGNAISFGAWYYHTSATTGHILGKTSSDFTYILSVNPDASQSFQTTIKTGTDRYIVATAGGGGALSQYNNSWVHLFVTYDGSTIRLYVNGVQQVSQAASGNIISNTDPFGIGVRGDTAWGYFNSTIDEVRVYNRGLSAQEVSDIYNDSGSPPSPSAPTISSFTASPASITSGSSSTLSWSTSDATTVSISPTVGSVSASGSTSVSPIETTTYTLTASNETGTTTAETTVTVGSESVAPVINSFTASPSSITSGQSSTLSWSVSGTPAPTLSINQGIGTVTGTSRSVSPVVTTTYTLTATNSAGTVSSQATVTVSGGGGSSGTVTVNPATTYQTIVGWEAVAQACHQEGSEKCVNFDTFKNDLYDMAIDIGINRLRLEVTTNPSTCAWNISELDETMVDVVLPLRQRLIALGEQLWLNLTVVDNGDCYGSQGPNPRPWSHYANALVSTYNHINSTYGFIPDSWEVALEPSWISWFWRANDIGQATIAGYNALTAAGYLNTYVIGPSTPGGGQSAINYFDEVKNNYPEAITRWKEFAYHRYSDADSYLSQIKSRAESNNMAAAMLEGGNARHIELHNDLKNANVVAWEQFALAYADLNDPQYTHYSYIDIPGGYSGSTVVMDAYAKYLRQYFKYVRKGAVRIGATGNATFDPLAFVNTDGKYVVVVKANSGGNFTVGGLPAGTYGIFYTSGPYFETPDAYNVHLSDQTITSSQTISASIPDTGVITIYAKTVGGGPTPPTISSFTASPASITSGSSSTLSWSTSDATTVSISPTVGSVSASGSTSVSPTVTTTYTLTATNDDGEVTATATVTVQSPPENQPPTVSAGDDQTVSLSSGATLIGQASDDGLPAGSTLTTEWTKVSGPGTVTFGNAASTTTTASFSVAGTYVLRLTASDTLLTESDEVTVTVSDTPPASGSCTAVGNGISVKDTSGQNQFDRTITISRVFKEGDIDDYPQAQVNGTPVLTQADVKSRWGDGSVKHVLISFISSVPADDCINVVFINQASGNNTGYLSKQDMLDYLGGEWDAEISTSLGTVSARTMLENLNVSTDINSGQVRYWMRGPIVTQVIVEDKTTALSYDFGSTAHKSLHPIFVLTFHPGTGLGVKVDYILENTWTTKLQDQTYSLTLRAGSPLAQVYSKASFTHYAQTRWRKTFWSGQAPTGWGSGFVTGDAGEPGVKIDHNLAYMIESKAIPNYDTSIPVSLSTVNSEVSDFNATDKGEINGNGYYQKYMPGTGQTTGDHIGILPTWQVRYLYTMGNSQVKNEMYKIMVGNAAVSGYVPVHLRESLSGRMYLDTNNDGTADSENAFGKILSLDARPNIRLDDPTKDTDPNDRLVPVGTLSSAHGWTPEMAHEPSFAYLPYLITGDWYYLEELFSWSSWNMAATNSGNVGWARHGNWGFLNPGAIQSRGQAWALRTLSHTAFASPDAMPEKTNYTQKVQNNVAILEGWFDIRDGAFPPSNPSCTGYDPDTSNDRWCWGNRTVSRGPEYTGTAKTPTLGFLSHGEANCHDYVMTTPSAQMCNLTWQEHMAYASLGHSAELEPKFNSIVADRSKYYIDRILDPNFNPYLLDTYQTPIMDAAGNYLTSWATIKNYYLSTIRNKTSWDASGASDYAYLAYAATSYAAAHNSNISGRSGGDAWDWMSTHIYNVASQENPKWTILPRSISSSPSPDTTPPSISLTAPADGTTVSGSISLTATASDNVGVSGVKFYRGLTLVGSEDLSPPYSISWDTTAISDGAYSLVAVARDASGNYATSTAVSVTVDNTAPTISSLSSGTPGQTTATITWTTDETATSRVEYGLTSSYGSATATSSASMSHSIDLSGLAAGTTYHYRAVSSDALGNVRYSSDQTFTTQSPPENQPPTVSAGDDQTVSLSSGATLIGQASDDGLPAGSTLTTEWTKVSGPGTVTFGNAASTTTTASFSVAGTYVLRLTASDTLLTESDEVTVTVESGLPPPVTGANDFTLTNSSGSTQTNYPVQIGRPFVQGEVPSSWWPQVVIGGVALPTQVDVKSRWGDGSLKHAILSFIIPSFGTGVTSVEVGRVPSPSVSNTPLSQSEMLVAGFDFDASISTNLGSASARQMLQNGHYTLWTGGPIATTIILADHTTKQYDIGSDEHKSLRPIFHATFWPSINKVKVRFIGEIADTEKLQDETYNLTLRTGSTSPTQIYTKNNLAHTANSRWTKEYWVGSQIPAAAMNPNLAYVASTTLVPNYDVTKTLTGISSKCSTWTSASKDLYDAGNWEKIQPNAGGREDIGPNPGWVVHWLYSGDQCLQEKTFGNADLSAAWPIHFREGKTGKRFLLTDAVGSNSGLGKPLSISGRPTIWLSNLAHGGTVAADKVTPVGTLTNGGWVPDVAHEPDPASIAYLLTGDYWYLEEMQFWASWNHGSTVYSIWNRPDTGEGIFNQDQIRGTAWQIRTLANVAAITPDSTPEKTYFERLMSDGIAGEEGIRNITGTAFQGNSAWNWGRNTLAPNWGMGAGLGLPPLNLWRKGEAAFAQADYGINTSVTSEAISLFETDYLMYALGRAVELGYPADALQQYLGKHYINILTNPAFNPYISANGRMPTVKSNGQYFSTWAELKTGYVNQWQNATNFYPQPSSGWVDASPPGGYAANVLAAASFLPGIIDGGLTGSNAWDWANTNILQPYTSAFSSDPMWAILPRSIGTEPTPPTISSFTASPASITSGSSSTLSWSTSGATTVSISPTVGSVSASGSTSVSPTVTTTYTLTATNDDGEVTAEATVTVESTPSDTTPPSAPSSLSATAISISQVDLSWQASTDNVGVTAYLIERCQGPACSDFSQIATTSSLSYSDSGRSEDTTYRYRLRATDAAENLSEYSNIASATTQGTPSTGDGDDEPTYTPPPASSSSTSGGRRHPIFTSVAVSLTRELEFGSRGDDVASAQRFLIERGYLAFGNDTGYYGPLTTAAVQAFQLAEEIADISNPGFGRIGPVTKERINAYGQTVLVSGSSQQELIIATIKIQIDALMILVQTLLQQLSR